MKKFSITEKYSIAEIGIYILLVLFFISLILLPLFKEEEPKVEVTLKDSIVEVYGFEKIHD